MCTTMDRRIIAFWRVRESNGHFSQFCKRNFQFNSDILENFPDEIKNLNLYKNKFEVLEKMATHNVYSCAEKWMMMSKAAIFDDNESFELMCKENSPPKIKKLGRGVSGFDPLKWNEYDMDIVKIGNYLKYSQNVELKEKIIATDDAILVEASPQDRKWGVGLRPEDEKVQNPEMWKGENKLGICLEWVRDLINKENM